MRSRVGSEHARNIALLSGSLVAVETIFAWTNIVRSAGASQVSSFMLHRSAYATEARRHREEFRHRWGTDGHRKNDECFLSVFICAPSLATLPCISPFPPCLCGHSL